MAGFIELATLKAPVVADAKGFKTGMSIVKKEGKDAANEIEKDFQNASKKAAISWGNASNKIQKSLKTTENDAKELTKSAENIYKDGFGKSANDVIKSLVQTKRALGDIDSKELETATKRALELRDTMGVKMSTTLKMAKQEMTAYGSTADQAFDRVNKKLEQNQAAWDKVGRSGEKFSTLGIALTAGVTTPLIGLGVATGKMASDFESANARVVSSLGLTEQQSAITKQAIQDIYSDGFGQSIDDVAESLIQVKRQLGDIPDDQIKKVTGNAMVLRDTLGQDMGESLRGINSLMVNFGLSADDAMDLYAKGVQTGLDKTNELGDNLAEYGQLWSQAGFSAKDMFAVLDNGLKSGAYNLDKVNDFVKEFTISLNDGRIQDNLKSFSKGTRDVFDEFKKGKATAQDVFKSVVTDLENTTNQQDKLALASTVWSALGEDNAMKIIESLNNVNGTYDNVAGSMDKVKKQQNETFGARTKTMFREAQTALLPLGETLLKLAERYMPQLDKSVATFSNTLSKVSPEDINNILKIGGFVAIAGPTVIGIAKVTKSIATVGDALKLGAGHLGLFQKSATLAGSPGGIGMLGTALAAVATPIGITTVAAAALAGGLAYLSYKQDKAREATEKWGTKVNSTSDNELSSFKTKVDETSKSMVEFETKSSQSADKVKKSFSEMYSEIESSAKKANERLEEEAKKIGATDEQIARGKAKNAQIVKNASSMTEEVKDIYNRHNGNVKKLTSEEKEIVINNQNEMIKAKLSLMDLSKKEQKAILTAMNGDVYELNQTQLQNSKKTLESMLKDEQKSYEDQRKALKNSYDNQVLTKEEYNNKLRVLEIEHGSTIEGFAGKYVRTMEAMDQKARLSGDIHTDYVRQAKKLLDEFGVSYEKVAQQAQEAANKKQNSDSILVKSTKDMTAEGEKAKNQWNAMVFDPKTLKVRQNASEEVKNALKAEGGWNSMKFILKEANLNTNARMTVADALVANGQWDSLKPEEKKLVVDGKAGMQTIFDSKENLRTWNSLPQSVKKLLGDNKDFLEKKEVADQTLKNWNSLPAEQKKLVAENSDVRQKFSESTNALKTWNLNEVKPKILGGDSKNFLAAYGMADKAVNDWNAAIPTKKELTAENKTGIPKLEAQATIDSMNGKSVDLDAVNRASGPKEQAQSSINSLLGKSVNLDAENKTNGPKEEAQNIVNSMRDKSVDITANNKTGEGVSGAKSAIDSVVGKTVDIVTNFIERVIKHESGTDYHPGGAAMVNDQKGRTYKELVTLPSGHSFIPEGRNVILGLPKGSKVMNANKTARLIPRYENGIGKIPADAKMFKQMEKAEVTSVTNLISGDDKYLIQVIELLKEILGDKNNSNPAASIQQIFNMDMNVDWKGKEDIRKTMQEIAWQTEIDKRGGLTT